MTDPRRQPTTREVLDFFRQTLRLNTRQAQHALSAGLAGPAVADGRARRYDAFRIIALHEVAELSDDEVWAACPHGVLIARIGPRRPFHLDHSWQRQAESVRDNWYVPWFSHAWLNLNDHPDGTFPMIATLANFVVFGATILGRETYGEEHHTTNRAFALTRFALAPPGPWYAALEARRLTLGPGYPWKIWGAPVSAPFDRTGLVSDEVSAKAARATPPRGRPRSPGLPASPPPSAQRPPRRSV